MNEYALLPDWMEQIQILIEEIDNVDDDTTLTESVEHLTKAREQLQQIHEQQ